MRFYTLMPMLDTGSSRTVYLLPWEPDLLVKQLLNGVLCVDSDGVPTRQSAKATTRLVKDCGPVAIVDLDLDDESFSIVDASSRSGGRVAVWGQTLDDLAANCKARRGQLLDEMPAGIAGALRRDPDAARGRLNVLAAPTDDTEFAGWKTWLYALIDGVPGTNPYPPAFALSSSTEIWRRSAKLRERQAILASMPDSHPSRVIGRLAEVVILTLVIRALGQEP